MRRIALLAALVGAAAASASAQEGTFVLERELATPYMTHRLSGWGHSVAEAELDERSDEALRAARRAVRRHGGRVIAAALTQHGIGDEDTVTANARGALIRDGRHRFVRRRGVLRVVFRAPAPLPDVGHLADAVPLSEQSTFRLSLQAWDRERRVGLGRPVLVRVAPAELERLRREPEQVKHTALGALLRRAWREALAGKEDDVELIEPRLEVGFNGLRTAEGTIVAARAEHLDPGQADTVLGRTLSLVERLRDRLGRLPARAEVAPDEGDLLTRAVERSRFGDAVAPADWDRLLELRWRDPATFSADDRRFLDELAAPSPGSSPGPTPARGLSGVVEDATGR